MSTFPIYEDALQLRNVTEGMFPFYIGIHTIDSYPVHHHEFAEIGLVFRGKGRMFINGVKHEFQPGTLFMLLPHQIHNFSNDTDSSLELVCCMFDIGILTDALLEPELSSLLLRIGDDLHPHLQLNEALFASAKSMIDELHREFQGHELGRNSIIRAKLVEVLLLFIRAHAGISRPQKPLAPEKKKETWKLIQYVNTHYMEDELTLEHLAAMFQVSVPYISRSFKELVGQSFLSYVHALRIRRASSLLASTEMTVSDIAAEVGFESFRTFSRVFKELKGVTPSEFRHTISGLQTFS
ncbi:AraC family transcriptional regulator [Paenibacillus sp. HJGM_3]|uniref:helix-turn-helix transcriptional regulator n=1 Tax=Paenibacillus sp. HJGM_3 TaxID=3379816 RepID=UPI00385D9E89